jgi:two-component system nitrogen regulation sensor histidine kinase NtrY
MTAEQTEQRRTTPFKQWLDRASKSGLGGKIAVALAGCAALAGVATYAALTKALPFEIDPNVILVLLYIDLVLVLALAAVVARRIVQVWIERRRGSAGSRLHVRLVALFSVVAVTPTIIVAIFSGVFFNLGLESWFSEKVRTAIGESVAVANAYLDENVRNIQSDALALSQRIQRDVPLLSSGNPADTAAFEQRLNDDADQLGLPEAVVFNDSFHVLARTVLSFSMEREPIPNAAIEKARSGQVALLRSQADDRVRALMRVDPPIGAIMPPLYLFVGRFVDPTVLQHVERAQGALAEYRRLEGARSDIEITFALIFVVVALLLLLASVGVGLQFATQLVKPISHLIAAAERVRGGDLSARVPESDAKTDEIGSLSRAFNRMTGQLEEQRRELIEANRQLDGRRRFTEAVLAGVSAGVIGLDAHGRINFPNRSAADLLSVDLEREIGKPLELVAPEMADLLREARRRPSRLVESEVRIVRRRRTRTLLVRISAERVSREVKGFVVTFDDISELLTAQRSAAWGDVARRIAHEIKNPLTPIQLSAERLKRKYLKEITSDRETFVSCTDTIVRQVNDIGRMVDEFSAFARMPAPVMKGEDLAQLCRQAVFLQRQGHPEIDFALEVPETPFRVRCDARQIGQALTNLLKNAAESIQVLNLAAAPRARVKGRVTLRLAESEGQVTVEVEDNGTGLPAENRDRLTEPYVTSREKGTGLGLAIVKKIMEDHRGELTLEDREGGGARVRLIFMPQDAGPTHDESDEAAAIDTETNAEVKPLEPTAAHGA